MKEATLFLIQMGEKITISDSCWCNCCKKICPCEHFNRDISSCQKHIGKTPVDERTDNQKTFLLELEGKAIIARKNQNEDQISLELSAKKVKTKNQKELALKLLPYCR